jgi:hypothetical protein
MVGQETHCVGNRDLYLVCTRLFKATNAPAKTFPINSSSWTPIPTLIWRNSKPHSNQPIHPSLLRLPDVLSGLLFIRSISPFPMVVLVPFLAGVPWNNGRNQSIALVPRISVLEFKRTRREKSMSLRMGWAPSNSCLPSPTGNHIHNITIGPALAFAGIPTGTFELLLFILRVGKLTLSLASSSTGLLVTLSTFITFLGIITTTSSTLILHRSDWSLTMDQKSTERVPVFVKMNAPWAPESVIMPTLLWWNDTLTIYGNNTPKSFELSLQGLSLVTICSELVHIIVCKENTNYYCNRGHDSRLLTSKYQWVTEIPKLVPCLFYPASCIRGSAALPPVASGSTATVGFSSTKEARRSRSFFLKDPPTPNRFQLPPSWLSPWIHP